MRQLLAALLLIVLPLSALAADYPARVVGVTDGDTLTVLRGDRDRIQVRLAFVDAPETGQNFGSRAKQAASELAFDRKVTVREIDHDRYGRTVAEVILPDGRSLGREMVSQGYAWWYEKYAPHDRGLARLQADAHAAGRGLRSQANPIPPWDWRHGTNLPITSVVIGNRKSHVYHSPHCRAVAVMRPDNRVEFQTAADAEEKGYHNGGDCK